MQDVGIGGFNNKLLYKAENAGRQIIKIPAKYTSQRCSCCEQIDKRNRLSQAEFKCINCGYQENADVNAAKNILRAGHAHRKALGEAIPSKPEARENFKILKISNLSRSNDEIDPNRCTSTCK